PFGQADPGPRAPYKGLVGVASSAPSFLVPGRLTSSVRPLAQASTIGVVSASALCSRKPAAPDLRAATSLPKVWRRKPLAAGTARSNAVLGRHWGRLALATVWVTVPATGPVSLVAGALTIRSCRNRFAVRLNSSVRRTTAPQVGVK